MNCSLEYLGNCTIAIHECRHREHLDADDISRTIAYVIVTMEIVILCVGMIVILCEQVMGPLFNFIGWMVLKPVQQQQQQTTINTPQPEIPPIIRTPLLSVVAHSGAAQEVTSQDPRLDIKFGGRRWEM
jgi:hypothetical protein